MCATENVNFSALSFLKRSILCYTVLCNPKHMEIFKMEGEIYMVRIALAVAILLFGVFSVLSHNSFSLAQLEPMELGIIGVCLVVAFLLIFYKKKSANGELDGIHTMTFVLEDITLFQKDGSRALSQGQQLYLRPYMGENYEQIAVTTEKAEVLGYLPAEHQAYVLSRIEAHRLTHTVVESLSDGHLGAYNASVRITC